MAGILASSRFTQTHGLLSPFGPRLTHVGGGHSLRSACGREETGAEPWDGKVVECFQEGVGFRVEARKGEKKRGSAPPFTEHLSSPPARRGLGRRPLRTRAPRGQAPGAGYLGNRSRPASDLRPHSRPGRGRQGGTAPSTASAAFSLSLRGRKRARSRQPTPGRTSPGAGPRPGSRGLPQGGVRTGNFWELGEERGAKRDERRRAPRSRFGTPGPKQAQRRVWAGTGCRAAAAAAGRGGRGERPAGAIPRPASRGRRRGRSGDRALVRGCGKRPRSQPAETPPPPPHLAEEPGRAARWGLGRRAPRVGAEGRRAEGRRRPGCAGRCGEATPRRPPRLALSPARAWGAWAMGVRP